MSYRILRRRKEGDLTFGEVSHGPLTCGELHAHVNARIVVVLSGALVEECSDSATICPPGTIIFRRGGERHRDLYLRAGATYLSIDLGRPGPTGLSTCFRPARQALEDTAMHAIELFRGGGKIDALLASVDTILANLAQVQGTEAGPDWLRKAELYVEQRSAESLTTAEIADQVGVHPMHLVKTMRRFRGETLGERCRKVRLHKAINELIKGVEPIGTIAVQNGFSDHSHLVRSLKVVTGLTPTDFRALAQS
jgi:AraC family transcriptional regulator